MHSSAYRRARVHSCRCRDRPCLCVTESLLLLLFSFVVVVFLCNESVACGFPVLVPSRGEKTRYIITLVVTGTYGTIVRAVLRGALSLFQRRLELLQLSHELVELLERELHHERRLALVRGRQPQLDVGASHALHRAAARSDCRNGNGRVQARNDTNGAMA